MLVVRKQDDIAVLLAEHIVWAATREEVDYLPAVAPSTGTFIYDNDYFNCSFQICNTVLKITNYLTAIQKVQL